MVKVTVFFALILAAFLLEVVPVYAMDAGETGDPAIDPNYAPYTWADQSPVNSPFTTSTDITRIVFTGRYANYTQADTWFPMWATDGNCYSGWTDGSIEGFKCISSYCLPVPEEEHHHTGHAKIVGDDVLNLDIINLGKMSSMYDNFYPCANVIADGVFYFGVYNAFNETGYFAGFRYSTDWDHWAFEDKYPWTNDYWISAFDDKNHNFFNESGKAKFRLPRAVVFGQNNSLSPDKKIYFCSHGYDNGPGSNNWANGDAVYMCRVDSKIEAVTNPTAYEFFAGRLANDEPIWSKKVTDATPVLTWPGYWGGTTISYIEPLGKYILVANHNPPPREDDSWTTMLL